MIDQFLFYVALLFGITLLHRNIAAQNEKKINYMQTLKLHSYKTATETI